MPKNKFFLKLREDKGARAIAITITVMLLVLTAIILTTVIANRAVEDPVDEPLSEPAGITDPGEGDDPQPDHAGENPDALPSFVLPVSGVLQKSYSADVQVFSDTMKDYRTHAGLDIGTVAGATVSAMADGVITQIFDDVSMGKCIAVRHNGDAYTIYKNLATDLPTGVAVGKSVRAGEVIGYVGESAMVELTQEPHLHVEMTVKGMSVDPLDYLDEDAVATLKEDTNYEDMS